MIEVENMPGMDEALAIIQGRLAEGGAEATQTTSTGGSEAGDEQTIPPDSAAEGQRAGQTTEAGESLPGTTTETGAPAAPKAEAAQTETSTTEPATPTEARPKSKYERDAERLPKSWKQFNAEKEAYRLAEAERVKALAEREAKLAQREQEIAAESQDFTPEQYEAHAGRKLSAADALEREADELEDGGKFAEAKAKRESARDERAWARAAKEAADQARKTPPNAKAAARKQQAEAQRKEWHAKAAIDFPDLVKAQSPLQAKVAELLAGEPGWEASPKAVYIAARLASAELAAARVPGLGKELEAAKKRIADLELATSPGGAGGPGMLATTADTPAERRAQLVRLLEQEQGM